MGVIRKGVHFSALLSWFVGVIYFCYHLWERTLIDVVGSFGFFCGRTPLLICITHVFLTTSSVFPWLSVVPCLEIGLPDPDQMRSCAS